MKTFEDLKFKPHPSMMEGVQAVEIFPNGYGVSVVRVKTFCGGGYGSYTSNEQEWELAVIKGTKERFSLCYDTHITNDVIGHLSDCEVSRIMKEVQEL